MKWVRKNAKKFTSGPYQIVQRDQTVLLCYSSEFPAWAKQTYRRAGDNVADLWTLYNGTQRVMFGSLRACQRRAVEIEELTNTQLV